MKNKIYCLLILILYISSCRKVLNCGDKEKLTFSKREFTGTQLKLNGYYYFSFDKYSKPLFIYQNGVLNNYNFNWFETALVYDFETQLIDGSYFKKVKENKYSWGLYYIIGNEIKYEVFSSKSAVSCYYPIIYTGVILNDTTIQFTNKVNSDGTESESINETYHFKQFSPKPDSTNSFIP